MVCILLSTLRTTMWFLWVKVCFLEKIKAWLSTNYALIYYTWKQGTNSAYNARRRSASSTKISCQPNARLQHPGAVKILVVYVKWSSTSWWIVSQNSGGNDLCSRWPPSGSGPIPEVRALLCAKKIENRCHKGANGLLWMCNFSARLVGWSCSFRIRC
jgi:hypothetical protein